MLHHKLTGSLIAACMVALGASVVVADTIRVPDDYSTIQGAINAAVDGDEISVAPGTYNEAIDFIGKAVRLYSTDGSEVTVIDGTGLDRSVVTCASGEGAGSIIEGFAITGGTGTPVDSGIPQYPIIRSGGGIYVAHSDPVVKDCVLIANDGDRGGAMYVDNGGPHVFGCRFEENTAGYSYLDDHYGYPVHGGGGGGIYNDGSSPIISACSFVQNHSTTWGAGIVNVGSGATISDCEFVENAAWDGGGISNQGGSPSIINCGFVGNSASGDHGGGNRGGGIQNANTRSSVVNCVFRDNWVSGSGGGISNWKGSAAVVNCTFVGNSAGVWGWGDGGGMNRHSDAAVTVANSVFWANIPDQIESGVMVTYSDVQGGWPGIGNIDADPLFVDAENGDFRLSPGSPCIDAGNNTVVPEGITSDLDGNPRFVTDPCTPATGNLDGVNPPIDMGAYEFRSPCFADIDCSGDVGFLDLLAVLAAWGPCAACPADLDDSGTVGFSDSLIVLASWGPCPQPGVCCLPDGLCEQSGVGGAVCVAMGGQYAGDDTLCDDVTCPQPGACCLADGSCAPAGALGGAECTAAGGVYQGDDIACDAVECPATGACCFVDTPCASLTATWCMALGGLFQGEAVDCADADCRGACCVATGVCIFVPRSQCDAIGGVYQGHGTCDTVTCPLFGACCLPEGTCDLLTEEECLAGGGSYLGDEIPCDATDCSRGACCVPDEPCIQVEPFVCDILGGVYQGGGTTCEGVGCP